ncbi:hypothetical protein EV385_6735 [Krasilnikovia cinnamomea]|uniref:Uncharacterized protein n=1 Tax=Krasilnikovia cinnamomea TaxID=349313 RepID=A0A4Q7Z883_9ACTN|nr:hypothetical protein [Krasilnikovia cinnamomea]RZU46658.1 hypothetical protein EV385_6735 [Krasilnikovia cinnamomea]
MSAAAAVLARRFLLQVWDAELGACVDVVGVLAVAGGEHAAVWLPRVWDRATRWQERLDGADDVAAAVEQWTDEAGGLQLTEIDPDPAGVDVRTAAEFALDELLAVVLPLVDGAV